MSFLPSPDLAPESFSDTTEWDKVRLFQVIAVIDRALELATGHDEFQRRKLAFYAVSTHLIHQYDPFPGLATYGPPGTGKTATLNILKATCYNVVSITAETISDAALRATMKDSDHGTLIIEEADAITDKSLEATLTTRYSKSSADLKKMVRDGDDWHLIEYATFGATIVHRRNLFRDPALLRRVITVQAKRKRGNYIKVDKNTHPEVFQKVHQLLSHLPILPEVTNRWDLEPATFECYKPLVALAEFIEDKAFLDMLSKEMQRASSRLLKEETYLEPQMLVRVIIALVSDTIKDKPSLKRINIENNRIVPALKVEFGALCPLIAMSANQRNRIIEEDLGFEIKSSHGRQRIYLTIPLLIHAAENYGVTDAVFDEWRQALDLDSSPSPEDADFEVDPWETENE
jgi:hypothetical protein